MIKPTKEDPVLLLLDGHSTHRKNIPLITKARDSGIIILSFPPHCTHRLQPLDVSVMGPLSTYYTQEVNAWLRNHPGRVFTQFQLASLFGAAYCKATTVQNAVSGFMKTGICPTNRHIFCESDFVAAETTEIPESLPSTSTAPIVYCVLATDPNPLPPQDAILVPSSLSSHIEPTPSTSAIPSTHTIEQKMLEIVSLADIMPIPKISVHKKI